MQNLLVIHSCCLSQHTARETPIKVPLTADHWHSVQDADNPAGSEVKFIGHVSRRHADRPDRFLIPRHMAPALVTTTDVLELDLHGVAVSEKDAKLFLERFINAEIYRNHPEVQAVVHSHAPGVLPFAAVCSVPVRVISHMGGFLQGMPDPFDLLTMLEMRLICSLQR